ncbi:flagellar hook-associated protein FlgL [Herbaspirillum sp. ST 5-3]|uniref:flagellar hook-associated protein FlgL n=1 Tax=Oxalobacteraceae TaxID=75682 RepID=UPI0010A40CA2|nr:flagellar hook-associated protein FlgL [Herbaspirillum sp. ST 5-3]
MRISTNTIFEKGATRLGEAQASLSKTQEQIATGRRILTPADDPVAAAQALELTQSQSINSQFAVNRKNVKNSLGIEEATLQGVTSLIQDVQTMAVNAGSGVLDNEQRSYLATELSQRLDELVGLANTRDGAGNYVFSGFSTATQPFARTSAGASYAGDQGARMLQVGPSRQMAMSDSGSAIFQSIKTGNGTTVTSAASTNSGSGIISNATLVGASTGDEYAIVFTSATQFTINNVTTNTTVSTGNNYVSGQAITVGEYQLTITGSPSATAPADTFSVKPSDNQDLFATLTNLIGVLNGSTSGSAGQAKLTNGLNTALNNLGNALDNVLTVRASVGARLKELDSLDSQGDDRDIQYAQSLQQLQDLDYTKAITDLTKQQTMLQAAQQAFVKTANLSLFSYLQ